MPRGRVAASYINLEDPKDELNRRVGAALIHHKVDPEEVAGRLFINGSDTNLVIASESKTGVTIHEPVVAAIEAEIDRLNLAVIVVDPFVSSHMVSENDNAKIDKVIKTWAAIARRKNIAILVVHHTRKMSGNQSEQGAEDARGAKAFSDAARSLRVLNRMDKDTAKKLQIEEKKRWSYIRVDDGKANLAPRAENAVWRHLVSVCLNNGPGLGSEGADWVGVITAWEPPQGVGMAAVEINKVLEAIKAGTWRRDSQARNWVGHAIAEAWASTRATRTTRKSSSTSSVNS